MTQIDIISNEKKINDRIEIVKKFCDILINIAQKQSP